MHSLTKLLVSHFQLGDNSPAQGCFRRKALRTGPWPRLVPAERLDFVVGNKGRRITSSRLQPDITLSRVGDKRTTECPRCHGVGRPGPGGNGRLDGGGSTGHRAGFVPYRAKRVGRLAGAATLVRSHSHTITALGRNQSWSKHVGRFAPGRYRGFRSSDGYLLVSVPWNLAKGRLRPAVLPFP